MLFLLLLAAFTFDVVLCSRFPSTCFGRICFTCSKLKDILTNNPSDPKIYQANKNFLWLGNLPIKELPTIVWYGFLLDTHLLPLCIYLCIWFLKAGRSPVCFYLLLCFCFFNLLVCCGSFSMVVCKIYRTIFHGFCPPRRTNDECTQHRPPPSASAGGDSQADAAPLSSAQPLPMPVAYPPQWRTWAWERGRPLGSLSGGVPPLTMCVHGCGGAVPWCGL